MRRIFLSIALAAVVGSGVAGCGAPVVPESSEYAEAEAFCAGRGGVKRVKEHGQFFPVTVITCHNGDQAEAN